jgi:hypothetical protein
MYLGVSRPSPSAKAETIKLDFYVEELARRTKRPDQGRNSYFLHRLRAQAASSKSPTQPDSLVSQTAGQLAVRLRRLELEESFPVGLSCSSFDYQTRQKVPDLQIPIVPRAE